MQIENSVIKGSDPTKGYPALWLERSRVNTVLNCVTQPGYEVSVSVNNGSSLHSQDDEFTSIEIDDAKAALQNVTVRETAVVQNQAAACILGKLNILGENDDKIDLGVMSNSVVYGDALTLNHVNTPNIRMTGNSVLSLKQLNYSGGEMSALNIEAENGCSAIIQRMALYQPHRQAAAMAIMAIWIQISRSSVQGSSSIS